MVIKERIIHLIEELGIPKEKFYQKIGMTSANFRGKAKYTPLNSNAIANILSEIPEVNPEWLITGKGTMLKVGGTDAQVIKELNFSSAAFIQKGYAPYYSGLLATVCGFDFTNIEQYNEAEGWIKIPGVEVDGWFPIVGCSMEPKIHAGDIVGVRKLEQWDRVDPDKSYLIVTQYDKMIKHLEMDTNDHSILWATSEKSKRFKIHKKEIICIFCIVSITRFV